jgi:transcriptional regulator with XRE-family HTH domain
MNENELIRIIGYNIKKYRLNKNTTIEKLSEITNLSNSYIYKLENQNTNINISINNLYKIATVLEVPISKFFEYEENN